MPRSKRRSSSPPRPVSSVPAARPASSVAQPAPQQPRQPGLFGQMASTAAGVAIGSTVGDAVSGALFGGESTKHQRYDLQQQDQGLCQYELQQFVDCAQHQGAVTLCQEFSEALKQCNLTNRAEGSTLARHVPDQSGS